MASVVGPVLLFLLLVFVESSDVGCPEGYRLGKHGNSTSCYIFSTKKLNWFEAKEFCDMKNGHLVVIEDADEDKYIRSYLIKNRIQIFTWFAASDVPTEGHWAWQLNDRRQKFTYTNWGPQQPDNWRNREDCGHFWPHINYKWNDAICKIRANFICEYANDTFSVVSGICNDFSKN